jgi:hypothetical protein
MFEYSIFEKSNSDVFSMNNLVKKQKNQPFVCFKIILLKKKLKIIVNREISLEDLYIKIYNAVYPDFSTEKCFDEIPNSSSKNSFQTFPKIYNVSLVNKDKVMSVPLHKFITLSSFMKSKPEFFDDIALFGHPMFALYVLDENTLLKIQNSKNEQIIKKNKRWLQCF